MTAPVLGIYGVAFAWAAGWSVMLLFEVPYLLISGKKEKGCRREE